ncbi:glutamate receptor ionotropic, delta-1-like [Panulirus ornatus]|uniref:glutamate receptor ionotropic, delta-1-like n=1 Tax=Panulirus ornatus TaxID=150431 RepID=UPI003A85AF95
MKLFAALGEPEVDPWGFLLPFAPLVWTAILTSLVVVLTAMLLLSSFISVRSHASDTVNTNAITMIRVLLQQDIAVAGNWWWERLVLGMWMMMTLVLTRSYAGNLMSLLAVRHIPQPYQQLQEVMDDPSVSVIWLTNSTPLFYYRSAESTVSREMNEAEADGRIVLQKLSEMATSVNTLLKQGSYVMVETETFLTMMITQAFSKTGTCDFYMSKEGFFPITQSLIGQKYSPLVPAMSKRIMFLAEYGLIDLLKKKSNANAALCLQTPSKVTVTKPFAMTNLWGIFIVLTGGYAFSIIILGTEMFTVHY